MKFAQVGYGSNGQGTKKDGGGYTYIVNDNVRKGDTINPSVVHYWSKNIFATTGKILGTTNNLQKIDPNLKQNDLAKAIKGSDVGITTTRGKGGKFTTDKSYHTPDGDYVASQYELSSRGANIMERQKEQAKKGLKIETSQTPKTEKAIDTFEEYSKKYIP